MSAEIWTAALAERLARERFGVVGRAEPLHGEHDWNFRLAAASGDVVVKIMRAGCPPGLVDLQCAMLAQVERRDPELAVPRVVRTRDGAAWTEVQHAGETRIVWLLRWLPGRLLAHERPRSPELLDSLGRFLGRLAGALEGFEHAASRRELEWDLARAAQVCGDLGAIADPARRELVARRIAGFEVDVAARLGELPRTVIHGDANDHNVLVGGDAVAPQRVVGLLDFGDAHGNARVCELAVAAAYALLDQPDPIAAAGHVAAGYHAECTLREDEIELLFALVCARLCTSVVISARRARQRPGDAYATVSERSAWQALLRLDAVHPQLATARLRAACGLPPIARGPAVERWLRDGQRRFAPVLGVDLAHAPLRVFDLGVGSTFLGADPKQATTAVLAPRIAAELAAVGPGCIGVGRWNEARLVYDAPAFGGDRHPIEERRTVHLGIDLFAPAGTPVHAPLAGRVACVAHNDARLDYGPMLILSHETDGGEPFHTIYGHLDVDVLERFAPGDAVARGARIATIGAPPVNGDWPPHLHFQLALDLLGLGRDFPGVACASQRAAWLGLSPDPSPLLGIPRAVFPPEHPTAARLLARRGSRIGRGVRTSFRRPLEIVRGFEQFLYDADGRAYLDAYNNVPHVGHSHPRVVRAACEQIALLNTNTRYLHENLARYAERLTALLPEPLSVCWLLNSASEANELALRLVRASTGCDDVIVLDAAYHGHTTTLIDVSPYKFAGPGGGGRKPWVHVVPLPDDYRGEFRRDDPEAGAKYARAVEDVVASLRARGAGPASFLAESLPSVGGQVVLPRGYLQNAYRAVRDAGGLCIADEVQVGFGRLGEFFWGFEQQDVVPDVVVLGKPIGNGFPLAAVVATEAVARAFDTGMEFFSTFGGNPVSCAVGLAVLDVIRDENLQAHARRVGQRLRGGLEALRARHALVGDVRGLGLFLGVELVRDRRTLEPAAQEAAYVVERLRERGVLTGTDGPLHNVVKIRPPMVFGEDDADVLVRELDEVLGESPIAR